MVSNGDKWIQLFDIPEVGKHKNGSTIYKVISMLYPESCRDAITKITVWKRFSDFKKLHGQIQVLHRKLNGKNKLPSLPSSIIFRRFDEKTIDERKQSILAFLEFVALQPHLFKSKEFVKFFETSHTPIDLLNSNINLIRADLNLPEEPEYCSSFSTNSDDDHTISDTDSVTTFSSLSPSVQTTDCASDDTLSHSKLKKLNSSSSIASRSSDTFSLADSMTLLDGYIYPTPPATPSSPGASGGYFVQYILDASVHVNLAVELENEHKYEEAFTAYKAAVDILIKYGKDDSNYERRQVVRYKTEKYLNKAEKLYNMYLAPEICDIKAIAEEESEQATIKRPLFDLYKFKVIKIVSSGMLVLQSEFQQLYFIKVIHKSMQFLNENLILPEDVPYMVKLHNCYNCENALFLVLQYSSGVTLKEYISQQSSCNNFLRSDNQILKQIEEWSDNDSDHSYSDLINDYTTNKKKLQSEVDKESSSSDDDSFVKIDLLPTIRNVIDEPLDKCSDVSELLSQSQILLSSVDDALTRSKNSDTILKQIDEKIETEMNVDQRKISDFSTATIEEFADRLIVPEENVVKWGAQLILALEKLHALGVVCKDLQAENVLIDETGDLLLTYMCNVKDLCDLYSTEANINLAPELYSFQTVTPAVDWWSFGAILYELLVGMPLSSIHCNGFTSYTHLKIPKYVSLEGRSLLRQLLTYESHDRLGSGINGTENLKSHPFFSSVSWTALLRHRK